MLEDLNFELLAKIDRCLKKTPPPPSLSSLDISNQGKHLQNHSNSRCTQQTFVGLEDVFNTSSA